MQIKPYSHDIVVLEYVGQNDDVECNEVVENTDIGKITARNVLNSLHKWRYITSETSEDRKLVYRITTKGREYLTRKEQVMESRRL
jgi:DNA-binding MarR family transcriptional regulator